MTFSTLPAVIIGGPPHSGKSVLAYSLTQTLRRRGVSHYVIRAYPPDGEGDWFMGGDPATVRRYRLKGARSEAWLSPLLHDIAERHLPLIVDMGGMPTPEQRAVLGACTHGILLTPDAATRAQWHGWFESYGLVLVADLRSVLRGRNALKATAPVIRGTLAGLERGTQARGPAFEALVDRLARLFQEASEGLRHRHLEQAPVELAVDVPRLARHLGVDPHAWPPEVLPRALEYLPVGQPLALYGRAPNWLVAAVAALARPAPLWLFDVRRGWVQAPRLLCGAPLAMDEGPVAVDVGRTGARVYLQLHLRDAYVTLEDTAQIRLPPVKEPVVVSGKLPQWLWAGLAQSLEVPWMAVMQPHLNGAVVVYDRAGREVGKVVPAGPTV